MSINLVPGFQASVQIKDKEDVVLYQESFPSQEKFEEFMQKNAKSRNGWSWIKGAFIPMRTDNLKDFAKDFFLPTFLNFTIKINNIALKIIASIYAIFLDLITLPIRLITTPFRIYHNCKNSEREHPLISLIKTHPLLGKAMDDNFVKLCYNAQNVIIHDLPSDKEGNTFQNATKSSEKGIIKINLKTILGGITQSSFKLEEHATYIGMNGEWAVENFSSGGTARSIYAF